jgi:hypothetical protein
MKKFVFVTTSGKYNFNSGIIIESETKEKAIDTWRDTMSPIKLQELNEVRVAEFEDMEPISK